MSYEFRSQEWNPIIVKAAETMYERLRIAKPHKMPPWDELGIDSFDHYCIAAQNCIEAFHWEASRSVTVSRSYDSRE